MMMMVLFAGSKHKVVWCLMMVHMRMVAIPVRMRSYTTGKPHSVTVRIRDEEWCYKCLGVVLL